MTYTNFPDGVTSFGVPILGGATGIPWTGNYYFVDAVNGSDGNTGGAQDPLQTIPQAYSLCKDGNNDVVVLISHPLTAAATTGTFRLSSTLTWAKSATHMIGVTAPTMIGQRARISTASGATTNLAPLLSISAQGCFFANFSIYQGVGESGVDEKLCDISGQRNYFWNVAFQGMGSTNGATRAGSYCVYLNGGSENTFENCQIGVDTIARTKANASVKLRSGATRNIFKGCIFPMLATSTGADSPIFVDTNAAASCDRFVWLKDCLFNNAINSDSAQAVVAVVAHNAAQGGTVIVDNCSAVGCTDWTGSDTATVQVTGPVPNGDTSGMAVASDKT